ncbi:MAG: hypothetical protein ABI467_23180 [Kofleriaceae bacterium]
MKSAFSSETKPDRLGRGLGVFSLVIGVTEVIAPTLLAKTIGVDTRGAGPALMRAFGAREIGAGIAVLMRPNKPIPLWARVAGDAMDLTFLALATRSRRASGTRLAIAAVAVAGVTALDVIASLRAQKAVAEINAAKEVEAKPITATEVPRKIKDDPAKTSGVRIPDLAH